MSFRFLAKSGGIFTICTQLFTQDVSGSPCRVPIYLENIQPEQDSTNTFTSPPKPKDTNSHRPLNKLKAADIEGTGPNDDVLFQSNKDNNKNEQETSVELTTGKSKLENLLDQLLGTGGAGEVSESEDKSEPKNGTELIKEKPKATLTPNSNTEDIGEKKNKQQKQQNTAKTKGSSKKLEIGSSVFAKWSGDDVWCRVIIMKLGPDFFNVVFPDYNKLGKVQRRIVVTKREDIPTDARLDKHLSDDNESSNLDNLINTADEIVSSSGEIPVDDAVGKKTYSGKALTVP